MKAVDCAVCGLSRVILDYPEYTGTLFLKTDVAVFKINISIKFISGVKVEI